MMQVFHAIPAPFLDLWFTWGILASFAMMAQGAAIWIDARRYQKARRERLALFAICGAVEMGYSAPDKIAFFDSFVRGYIGKAHGR